MEKRMTDAEFWAVLAINMEQAGTLPGLSYKTACPGLCAVLMMARWLALISKGQERRLYKQLQRVGPAHAALFWWPQYAVAPRVAACRKLARLTSRGRA